MARDDKLILLVEDNSDDVELTIRTFQAVGIKNKIVIARDGVEALDYLMGTGKYEGGARPPLPDLVLLDLKLPKMDGLDVLRQMRTDPKTKRLPVVVLTSSKENKDLLASYDLGANSYIPKPVDFGRFHETARQIGDYWLGLNVTPSV